MGDINNPNAGYKQFAAIRNDDTVPLTDGDIVSWSTGANKILGVDVVRAPSASGLIAGVVTSASIAVGGYGQIQVKGVHNTVKSTNAGVVLGGQVIVSSTAGKGVIESGGELTNQLLGVALSNAAGASGSQTAVVDIY